MNIEEKLKNLEKSKFRSSFHLNKIDQNYIQEKGLEQIELHAHQFIEKRLAPSLILNDGRQTPFRGHPVFKAQHATATCCRSCLFKWHHIQKNKELSKEEQDYVVTLIMKWIKKEMHVKCLSIDVKKRKNIHF